MLGSAVRTVREPPLPSKIVGDTFGWFGSDWACFGNLKQDSCAVGSGLNEKRPRQCQGKEPPRGGSLTGFPTPLATEPNPNKIRLNGLNGIR